MMWGIHKEGGIWWARWTRIRFKSFIGREAMFVAVGRLRLRIMRPRLCGLCGERHWV